MKSAARGPSTSPAEVTNVRPHGFWVVHRRPRAVCPLQRVSVVPRGLGSGNHECPAPQSPSFVLAGSRRRFGCGIDRAPREISSGEPRAAHQALAADEGASTIEEEIERLSAPSRLKRERYTAKSRSQISIV